MKIESFSGGYRFLSNFYPSKVQARWDGVGVEVQTVEHAYQAEKAADKADFDAICTAATPGIAKRMGRKVTLRPAWETLKLDVMERLLQEKFSDPDLRKQLRATGDAVLVEGNKWGDVFWGSCNGKGANHLGRLLMEVRSSVTALGIAREIYKNSSHFSFSARVLKDERWPELKAMGKDALPDLFLLLSEVPSAHVMTMIYRIADEEIPVPKEEAGYIQKMVGRFMDWGREKGYVKA